MVMERRWYSSPGTDTKRQVSDKLPSHPPGASTVVPQIHRFPPRAGREAVHGTHFCDLSKAFPRLQKPELGEKKKSHLPNDFLMFVSLGEICHAFNLLQKKSGNTKCFMIFKCSNTYFSASVFITIMFVAEEVFQGQRLTLLSASNTFYT